MASSSPASPALHEWQSRVRNFLYDCAGSEPEDEADRIRDACILFLDAPDEARDLLPAFPDEDEIETLIAAGALETAALEFLGLEAGFILSRGCGGTCLASVVLADSPQEMTAQGPTLVLALLSALASALIAEAEEEKVSGLPQGAPAGVRLH